MDAIKYALERIIELSNGHNDESGVKNYFSNRSMTCVAGSSIVQTVRVPQGSVLGPVLWNVVYDNVLDLRLPDGCMSVAYADDHAVVVTAEEMENLIQKTEEEIDEVDLWMLRNKLKLANEKTEIVIFPR